MSDQATYHHEGFDIPIGLMLKTGGGPDTFAAISNGHIANLRRFVGLTPDMAILEIGCGIGRDAIPLTTILDPAQGGRYVGIDIIKPSIDWCVANIQKRHPNFIFHHMDIGDQIHNPGGAVDTLQSNLPVPDGRFDRIVLQSVFTHLMQRELEHYLTEFRRVLKLDGLVYVTVFIYDDAVIESAHLRNPPPHGLRFEHKVGTDCRINDLQFPTGAVAYTEKFLNGLVCKHGLRQVRPHLKGSWSGFHDDASDGQDILVLARA